MGWFQRFSSFLIQFGFHCSLVGPSLFLYYKFAIIIYLFMYVDDIVIIGNNNQFLNGLIDQLGHTFSMKDLGPLHYFFGIEVHYQPHGLFLSQTKYALDLLDRAAMVDSKPFATPMVVGQYFSSVGNPFTDPSLYRSLVGVLQYLTITRPDLSYSVNMVNSCMRQLRIISKQ